MDVSAQLCTSFENDQEAMDELDDDSSKSPMLCHDFVETNLLQVLQKKDQARNSKKIDEFAMKNDKTKCEKFGEN